MISFISLANSGMTFSRLSCFPSIFNYIVQFKGLFEICYRLPLVFSNGKDRSLAFIEYPIKVLVLFLIFKVSEQGRQAGNAITVL
ncbi:hypothetical protein [Flagellimonas sp. MMG031]|uniref:Uncharacterized protein n=1 Tax=Flagellimonas sp. MMG031 TaxID=3158549 RepID=A0AAU7MZC6_9FLAO